MSKNLYNISSVVVSNKASHNLFELTSIKPPRNYVASQDLVSALENSPPNVRNVFSRVLGSSSLTITSEKTTLEQEITY
jgi:hypothetical protein